MPATTRTAQDRSRLPDPQTAALAALSVSESLMLAMIESGCLDPQVMRRCLLDAVAAHTAAQPEIDADPSVHAEAIRLIDCLLRQVDAAAPGDAGGPWPDGSNAR